MFMLHHQVDVTEVDETDYKVIKIKCIYVLTILFDLNNIKEIN